MRITDPRSPENADLLNFASSVLGGRLKIDDLSRAVGRQSVTWRITASDGSQFYFKRHDMHPHYRAEVRSLREWVLKIPAADWWRTPEVVASSDELGAVVITSLEGELVEGLPISEGESQWVYRRAGEFAARLHALEIDLDGARKPQGYGRERLNTYIDAAEPYLDHATVDWTREITEEADTVFAGLPVVPTHCDYSPRNWLLDRASGEPRLVVIDWERARPGYWLEDAQRMAQDHWVHSPELRDAFFEGYGRVPDSRGVRQLNFISMANALGAVSWGTKFGDSDFVELARQMIKRLKNEL
jgi:aminoglycoside phosphotransferase (APT) family kinase protein